MCCVEEKADDGNDPEDEEYEMLNMPPQRAVFNGKSLANFSHLSL